MEKRRILVVDDRPVITRALKQQLEKTGRFVVHAENSGQAALKAARQFKPEMAILDVMMPGMDGGELKQRLLQMPGFAGMPVAYLTAAYREGENNDKELFIEKPVKIDKIIDTIDRQLGGSPQVAAS
ncbi:MAG TPA: response regulator [Verrucomicrobiales bacterium]|nr:response regulator [Verrucomicrobiales bacterium]